MNSKPKYKSTAKSTPIDLFASVGANPIPDTFKVGRELEIRGAEWQGTLWEAMEAQATGSYVISGEERTLSSSDFISFKMGAAQILYNQSYQSGNLDTNSGLAKIEAEKMGAKSGHTYYEGHIVTTLNDLCRKSYGVAEPSTKQKKAMETLLFHLHRNFVTIQFPNGDTFKTPLVVIRGEHKRAEDGAKTYWLSLNPIFCENVKRNFIEFPQDARKRLTEAADRVTDAHLHLLNLLGMQMRTKTPYIINTPVLIKKLGMEREYRKNRGAAEKRLLSICDDIQKTGQITKYEVEHEYRRGREWIAKINFYLNPYFVRKRKKRGEDTDQTDS